MTLAARCPACGTVFRVVQDQLRVSEGWVRCGRCAEVFNAIETLVEIDTDLPPRDPAKDLRTGRVIADLQRVARASAMPPAPEPQPAPPPPLPPPPPPAAMPVAGGVAHGESTVVAAMAMASAVAEPPPAVAPAPAPAAAAAAAGLVATRDEPVPMPTFVRQAERAARWRRPGVRAALAGAGVVLTATLALQVAVEYRDHAAARFPALRPLLQAACGAFGCSIHPPRAIESLTVDASGLVRVEGTAMYKLSVTLKNRSDLALAAPALDLTLTDSQGGVLARRVVRLTDLGLLRPDVPPATTLPLQATLAGPDRQVSGYTIELFYP